MMEKESIHQNNMPKATTHVRSCLDVQMTPLSELFCRSPMMSSEVANQSPIASGIFKNFDNLTSKFDSTGQNVNADDALQEYFKYFHGKKLPVSHHTPGVKDSSEAVIPDGARFCSPDLRLKGPCELPPSNNKQGDIDLKRLYGENDLVEAGSVQENGLKRLKKGANRENTAVLRNWLDTHRLNPYPTKDERDLLAVITGLSQQQISTWFANARRRLKKQNPLLRSTRHRQDDSCPLWQHSDPESSAASADVPAREHHLGTTATPTTPLHADSPYCSETSSTLSTSSVDMAHLLDWAREQLRVINWFNFFTQFYHQATTGSIPGLTQRLCSEFSPSAPLPDSSDSAQLCVRGRNRINSFSWIPPPRSTVYKERPWSKPTSNELLSAAHPVEMNSLKSKTCLLPA
ncbi:Iroquois-class homeodomain protein IRX-5 [Sparganum proliferum]